MTHNWRTALFKQAFSDYQFFMFVARHGRTETYEVELCHLMHYLQMATEKLSKGFQSDGVNPPRFEHTSLEKFFKNIVPKHEALRNHFGYSDFVSFRRYLNGMNDIVQYVARLAPGGKRGECADPIENPEYPWETRNLSNSITPNGNVSGGITLTVHVPSEHPWPIWKTAEMIKFLEFLDRCIRFAQQETY